MLEVCFSLVCIWLAPVSFPPVLLSYWGSIFWDWSGKIPGFLWLFQRVGLLGWFLYRTCTARFDMSIHHTDPWSPVQFLSSPRAIAFLTTCTLCTCMVWGLRSALFLSAGISAAHLIPNVSLLPNSWGFSICSYYVRYLVSQNKQSNWPLKENHSSLSSFTKKISWSMKNLTSNKIMLNHVNMLQSVNDWNWDADNSEAYFKSW